MSAIASRNPAGRRVITATPIPFGEDGSVDLDAFKASIAPVAAAGLDGVFVAGTTGEFPALSHDERVAIFEAAVAAADGLRVIGHAGAGSAREVSALVTDGTAVGVREFAVITPYYLPASEHETLRFYEEVASRADGVPLYAYLFEARTTTKVSPELLAKIATIDNVVGAKLSGVGLDVVKAYRAATPPEFELYTGNDADLPYAEAAGIQGVVSGVSAAYPELFARLVAALGSGDADLIGTLATQVLDTVTVIVGDIARIKWAQRERGLVGGRCRMAIDEPSPAVLAEIRRTVAAYV